MKTKLLLLAVSVAAFTSCSTMYKTGQTPDDVYYSPARTYDEAQKENKEEVRNEPTYVYTGEDRMIRMGISDTRWRNLNYDYGYSPYDYSSYNRFNSSHGYYGSNNHYGNYSYNYNSNFNNVYFNDYYYNPFYSPYPVYIKPATLLKNSTPRITNLNGYSHNYNNANAPLMSIPAARPVRNYNNTNRTSALGNVLDKVLTPSSNNSNNNNSRSINNNTTERTYTPPPASSSNSSSGSSSSGGSSRITRPN